MEEDKKKKIHHLLDEIQRKDIDKYMEMCYESLIQYPNQILEYKDISTKSEQSHYFIKFDKKIPESTFEELNAIVFASRDNTVGPRSISKPELMEQYNTIVLE